MNELDEKLGFADVEIAAHQLLDNMFPGWKERGSFEYLKEHLEGELASATSMVQRWAALNIEEPRNSYWAAVWDWNVRLSRRRIEIVEARMSDRQD